MTTPQTARSHPSNFTTPAETVTFFGSTLRLLLWSFGFFTIPVLSIATLWHTRLLMIGQPSSWLGWLISSSFEWYPWAVFMPLIVHVSRAFPLVRERLTRHLSVHLIAAIILSATQNASAVVGGAIRMEKPLELSHLAKAYLDYMVWMEPWSVMIYGGILATVLAIELRSRVTEGKLLATRLESELTKSHLEALQSQLQPHFLFNALNSISVLMRKGDIDHAQQMLGKLSDLLRQILSRSGAQTVLLSEELELVQQYLAIEQARFGNRLSVKVDAEPRALTVHFPAFLLQTLVENAVRHGLSQKSEGGHLSISASCDNNYLVVRVTDDGVGMMSEPTIIDKSRVGLRNARSRLECLYGRDHSFTIQSASNEGTSVTVTTPIRTD